MDAVKSDLFFGIDDLADTLRPRRKSVVDRLVGRMAVGQISGETYLYEVHGPFVPPHRQPPRRSLTTWLIGAMMARLHRLNDEARRQRSDRDMAGLDDHVLKDIGISRAEIASAVRRESRT